MFGSPFFKPRPDVLLFFSLFLRLRGSVTLFGGFSFFIGKLALGPLAFYLSLAATWQISLDFFSFSYLDVSVR